MKIFKIIKKLRKTQAPKINDNQLRTGISRKNKTTLIYNGILLSHKKE